MVSYGWPEIPPKLRDLRDRGAWLLRLGHFTSWYHARTLRWRLQWKLERFTVWRALASWKPDVVCASQGGSFDMVSQRVFTRFLDEQGVPYIVICQYTTTTTVRLGARGSERPPSVICRGRDGSRSWRSETCARPSDRSPPGCPTPASSAIPSTLSDFRPVPYPPKSDVVTMANVARLNVQFKGQDVLLEALGGERWRAPTLATSILRDRPRPALPGAAGAVLWRRRKGRVPRARRRHPIRLGR